MEWIWNCFAPLCLPGQLIFFPENFLPLFLYNRTWYVCVSLVDKIVLDIVFYPLINDFDSTLWIVYFYAMFKIIENFRIYIYIYIYIYIVFHRAKFFHFIGINPIFNETFLKNSPTNSSIYILRWPQTVGPSKRRIKTFHFSNYFNFLLYNWDNILERFWIKVWNIKDIDSRSDI